MYLQHSVRRIFSSNLKRKKKNFKFKMFHLNSIKMPKTNRNVYKMPTKKTAKRKPTRRCCKC